MSETNNNQNNQNNWSNGEGDSTYRYSYRNGEQNPNNVWRAEENTAGRTAYNSQNTGYGQESGQQSTSYSRTGSYGSEGSQSGSYGTGSTQSGSYGTAGSQSDSYRTSGNQSSSYGTSGSQTGSYGTSSSQTSGYGTGGSQTGSYGASDSQTSGYGTSGNQSGSYGQSTGYNTYTSGRTNDYSNIYGNQGESGAKKAWSTYTESRKQRKEQRAARRAQRGQSSQAVFGIKLAKAASIALVFGLVGGTAFQGSSYLMGNVLGSGNKQIESSATPQGGEDREVLKSTASAGSTATQLSTNNVAAIAKEVMPSIVAITNMSEVQYQNWFGQVQSLDRQSAGSGIIISEDDDYLYIATNNHVVENATTLTVQFSDDSTATAEVRGTDPSSDLAVVKVKKSDINADTMGTIKIATLGDSDSVEVGSQAIAIGNALGYGQSVTEGIVSALNREVTTQDETTGESFTNTLLQTDAAINPGNSGGALLNSNGEVIGINSSKYSDTTVEGMGFAIPSNTAKPIIEDLITREVVSEEKAAFLGINGVDVSSSVASTYNMPEGVYIAQVNKGTAAEKAGLRKGDIITAFDGKSVKSMQSLQDQLKYYEAGAEVEITIQRSGENGYEEQTIAVTLGKKNA